MSRKTKLKPGLYWGRYNNYQWWNLIVEVEGIEPFFNLTIWDRSPSRKLLEEIMTFKSSPPENMVIGPRIEPMDGPNINATVIYPYDFYDEKVDK